MLGRSGMILGLLFLSNVFNFSNILLEFSPPLFAGLVSCAEVANMNCEGMEDILESAIPEISAAVKSILRSGVNSMLGVTEVDSVEMV